MKEGLLQLLQLQAVDKEVFTLEEAKEKYPTEISERQREIENAQAHLIDLEATLEELGKKQRHCEREIESGKVKPLIDRTYPLGAAADAHRHMDDDHIGKIVLTTGRGDA